MIGILNAHDNADPASRLGVLQLVHRSDQCKDVGTTTGIALPVGEIAQRIGIGVGATQAEGVVEAGYAARLIVSNRLLAWRLGIGVGGEIHMQGSQHVDDQRLSHDIHRAPGIFSGACRAQRIIAEIDHRKCQGSSPGSRYK